MVDGKKHRPTHPVGACQSRRLAINKWVCVGVRGHTMQARTTPATRMCTSRHGHHKQQSAGRQAPRHLTARGHGGSRLDAVEMAPPDPILGVSEAFKRETSTDKLNLGVGAYRTEELQPYVLRVVGKAEKRMLERGDNKEYLSIEGLPEFRAATVELLLGADSAAVKEGRVATLQSLSGTGSLRVAAAFLAKFLPGVTVYLSRPTWGNHKNIFGDAGVEWREYAYFNPATVSLDFDGMLHDIAAAPAGSVILLHGCAHNPTGIDPTREQWSKIADVIEERHHLAFFDVAYQGFASGSLDDDAFAPRLFVERGLEVLVAQVGKGAARGPWRAPRGARRGGTGGSLTDGGVAWSAPRRPPAALTHTHTPFPICFLPVAGSCGMQGRHSPPPDRTPGRRAAPPPPLASASLPPSQPFPRPVRTVVQQEPGPLC
uniref:Aminotransferase class I/classII large domain-containing protein n=1 Tax=Auxenochlorella protothecoides TaxID=3075 RepID=A0A1D1ZYE6_AUXPR